MSITPAMLRAAVEGRSILDGTPQSIEASEKRGQQQLVQSTNMPLDLDKEQFEKAGFTFGAKIDECFQEATLPPGWSRAATSHSMHSEILDEKGRKRGVLGLLGCIFVALKLCNVIDWSWWWITAPFWGGFALVLVGLTLWGIVALALSVSRK